MFLLIFLDIALISSIAVLELCKYDKFDAYPKLKKWIEEMKTLPKYNEIIGNPSAAVVEIYQAKLVANAGK